MTDAVREETPRLPDTLRWLDFLVHPPYRDDPQDKVISVLWAPGFYEPAEDDDDLPMCADAEWVGYHCLTHDKPWLHGGQYCPDHDTHEIALFCSAHGLEVMSPQPHMLENPSGFEPPLTEGQLASLRAEW